MYDDVEALAEEVRLTFHALGAFAREAGAGELDPSGRALLEYLCREGPSTVPVVARARGVSRQHIQTIVNALREERLVEVEDNPAHRRSPLVTPTASGRDALARVSKRGRDLLTPHLAGLDHEATDAAAATLADLRCRLAAAIGAAT